MPRVPEAFKTGLLIGVLPLVMAVACNGPPPPAPPDTPTGLSAEPGAGAVTLSWEANTEPNLAAYNIYRGESSQELDHLAEVDAGTLTFTDTEVESGVTYHYAIDAEDDRGARSPRTETVSATPTAEDTTGIWDSSAWDGALWAP